MSGYTIKDESTDYKYFSQIPNVIYFIGLDVYQISLYVTIKCFSGDRGSCTKSVPNLAKCAGMSERKLQQVILSLCEINPVLKKPLISSSKRMADEGDQTSNEIKIKDIWPENMKLSPGFMGGGAQYAPPPAPHAPPGAQDAPGVVHTVHRGGAHSAPKQYSFKNTPFKKTTTTPTPSKEKVVGVVVTSKEKEKAIKEDAAALKAWIDGESEKKRPRGHQDAESWGASWVMPLQEYIKYVKRYGIKYVMAQATYMWNEQMLYEKKQKKKPIGTPTTYLRIACEKNYADYQEE